MKLYLNTVCGVYFTNNKCWNIPCVFSQAISISSHPKLFEAPRDMKFNKFLLVDLIREEIVDMYKRGETWVLGEQYCLQTSAKGGFENNTHGFISRSLIISRELAHANISIVSFQLGGHFFIVFKLLPGFDKARYTRSLGNCHRSGKTKRWSCVKKNTNPL